MPKDPKDKVVPEKRSSFMDIMSEVEPEATEVKPVKKTSSSFNDIFAEATEGMTPGLKKKAETPSPTPPAPSQDFSKTDFLEGGDLPSTGIKAESQSTLNGDTAPAPLVPSPAPAPTPKPVISKNPFKEILTGNVSQFLNGFNDGRSLLERDIDLDNNTKLGSLAEHRKAANPNSLTSIITSRNGLAGGKSIPTREEVRKHEKEKVLSDPDALRDYTRTRQRDIAARESQIKQRQAQIAAGFEGFGGLKKFLGFGSAVKDEEEYSRLNAELEGLKEFKGSLSNAVQEVAKVKVPQKLMASGKMPTNEEVGRKYLETINDPEVSDDSKTLTAEMPVTDVVDYINRYKNESALDFTKEKIRHKLDETGAQVMSGFYSHNADRAFEVAKPKLETLATLTDKMEAAKGTDKEAYAREISSLRDDADVQNYLGAQEAAIDYDQQAKTSINKYPQVKREKIRQEVNDAFMNMVVNPTNGIEGELRKFNGYNAIFGEVPKDEDIAKLAEATGRTKAEVKEAMKTQRRGFFSTSPDGVRIESFLTGIAKGTDETIGQTVAGARRILGNGPTADIRNRVSADQMEAYMMNGRGNDLVDEFHNYHFNPYSVGSTLGRGIAQVSIYGAPALATGGLGGLAAEALGAVKAAGKVERVAQTVGTLLNPASYDAAWKEGAKNGLNEEERRGYATLTMLANNAPEMLYSPADMIKGAGNIFRSKIPNLLKEFTSVARKEGVSAAVINGLKKAGVVAKEKLDVLVAENVEEQATNVATNFLDKKFLGKVKTSGELAQQFEETWITTTLQTLPVAVGAGIHGANDLSGVRKQALFESGVQRDTYLDRVKSLFDSGALNQSQYNEKVSTINTMNKIVASLPKINADGKPLTYEERVDLASQQYRIANNNKISETASLEAEKDNAKADSEEAKEIQKQILSGQLYRVNGKPVTREEMNKALDTGTPDDFFEISNDQELQDKLNAVGKDVTNTLSVDTGNRTSGKISEVAEKVVNNEPLTPEETQLLEDNPDESAQAVQTVIDDNTEPSTDNEPSGTNEGGANDDSPLQRAKQMVAAAIQDAKSATPAKTKKAAKEKVGEVGPVSLVSMLQAKKPELTKPYQAMVDADPEGTLQFIAEQAGESESRKNTTEEQFGKEIVDAAMALFPAKREEVGGSGTDTKKTSSEEETEMASELRRAEYGSRSHAGLEELSAKYGVEMPKSEDALPGKGLGSKIGNKLLNFVAPADLTKEQINEFMDKVRAKIEAKYENSSSQKTNTNGKEQDSIGSEGTQAERDSTSDKKQDNEADVQGNGDVKGQQNQGVAQESTSEENAGTIPTLETLTKKGTEFYVYNGEARKERRVLHTVESVHTDQDGNVSISAINSETGKEVPIGYLTPEKVSDIQHQSRLVNEDLAKSKKKDNANKEQSPTEVPVRNQSEDGERVEGGTRTEAVQEATGKGEAQEEEKITAGTRVVDPATGKRGEVVAINYKGSGRIKYDGEKEETGPINIKSAGIVSEKAFDAAPKPEEGSEFNVPEESTDAFPAPKETIKLDAIAEDGGKLPLSEAQAIVNGWDDVAEQISKKEDNSKRVILSLFDFTGNWSQPWHVAGFTTIHIDIQHNEKEEGDEGEISSGINQDDLRAQLSSGERRIAIGLDMMRGYPGGMMELEEVLKELGYTVDGILSATPCTTFAGSGAAHWKDLHGKEDFDEVFKRYGWWGAKNFKTPHDFNKTLVDITGFWFENFKPRFHVMENPVGRIRKETGIPAPLAQFHPHNFGDPYTKKTQLWGNFNPNLPIANVDPTQGSKIQKLSSKDKVGRSATPLGFAYAFFMANYAPNQQQNNETSEATSADTITAATTDANEGSPKPTEAIIAQSEAALQEAENFETIAEAEVSLDNIEAAIEAINAKVKELTGVYSTKGIAHESPNIPIGKSVAKELQKIANLIQANFNWNKDRVHPNIAPAGGEVYASFSFTDLEGKLHKVSVSATYEPEDIAYDNYTLKGYRINSDILDKTILNNQPAFDVKDLVNKLGVIARKYPAAPKVAPPTSVKTLIEAGQQLGTVVVGTVPRPTPKPPRSIGSFLKSDTGVLYEVLSEMDENGIASVKPIEAVDGTPINGFPENIQIASNPSIMPTPFGPKGAVAKTDAEKRQDKIKAAKEKFKASMKRSRGQLNFGVDPQLFADAAELLIAYAEDGVHRLSAIVRRFIEDGDTDFVKDQENIKALRTLYAAYRENLPREERVKYDTTDQLDDFFENEYPALLSSVDVRPGDFSKLDAQFENEIKGEPHIAFKDAVKERIRLAVGQNIVSLRKLAQEVGLDVSDIELQELAELAVVEEARAIANDDRISHEEKLARITDVYNRQPSLNQRSSTRVELQQYSTPAPISYLGGHFINGISPTKVFEPSAGNGLLTIAFPTNIVSVNEIDDTRLRSLGMQNFRSISSQDATEPFRGLDRSQDGVITNPPFGTSEMKVYDGYKVRGLAPQMAINALETMKDNGRAAIIIGGHNSYDDKGVLQKERFFFNYLYNHYNVADVINIDGQLYSKQGTSFDIRMILIDGRKSQPSGFAPTQSQVNTNVVSSFAELNDRIKNLNYEKRSQSEDGQPNLSESLPGEGQQSSNEQTGNATTVTTETSGVDTGKPGTGRRPGADGGGNVGGQSPTSQSNTNGDSALSDTVGSLPINDTNVSTGTGTIGANRPAGVRDDIRGDKPVQSPRQLTSSDLAQEKIKYEPMSQGKPVNTVIPTQMASEAQRFLSRIDGENGGIDNFVMQSLGYNNLDDLYKAFSAEQVDALAMAIYQIENNSGMVIGDMTGVGKGRIAAGIIRYGVLQGFKPIFLTEKTALFSDIYRDLKAIGSKDLIPFIVNDYDKFLDPTITDEDGTVVYKSLPKTAKNLILQNRGLPEDAQWVVASYSQFRGNPSKPSIKRDFFRAITQGNILIMDESHNAGGDGNTGELFQDVLEHTKGVTYLSATFAKTPKNMPVYSVKTAMREANMTKEDLILAIEKGGVALQEVVSSQLVESGQMLRRERNFDGVEIDYEMQAEHEQRDRRIADNITDIIRDVIQFQERYVSPVISNLDAAAQADAGNSVSTTAGTSMAGVSNVPFASRVFNVVDQFLFAIKAEAAADAAIEELKKGRKPVLKFKSTMESFLTNEGYQIGDELASPDFSLALKRTLDTVMKYTTTSAGGDKVTSILSINDLFPEGRQEYKRLSAKIKAASVGISVSPIDLMIYKIEKAGYTVGEITGRKMIVRHKDDGSAVVEAKGGLGLKDIVRGFNNGTIDVVMLNASGATGISLHASRDFKDQRQRVMISPQLELDINKEIQGRGRIDRTGQVVRGAYRYIVSSIPAELRLLMMFQAKVKSLDANTTSSQKSKTSKVDLTDDFLNKYGDEIITEYLKEHPETNEKLLDPLKMIGMSEEQLADMKSYPDAARKTTGKVAILSSVEQEKFYKEVGERYKEYLEYKNSINENELEVKVMPLQAKTLSTTVRVVGKGGVTPFGADSILEKVEANILRKPMTKEELDKAIAEGLNGRPANSIAKDMVREMESYIDKKISDDLAENDRIISTKKSDALAIDDPDKRQAELDKLEDARLAKAISIENKLEGLRTTTRTRLNFFTVGRPLKIPVNTNVSAGVSAYSNGVFLGFEIKENTKNRYAPSNIKLKFAIEDSRKQINVPSSQSSFLDAILSASYMRFSGIDNVVANWGKGKASADRGIQYIVTGNILQAYAEVKGQLVSYSTDKGELKKGILLSEGEEASDKPVKVPFNKAERFITDTLRNGGIIASSDGDIELNTSRSRYMIEVPKSRQRGGKYFLNDNLRNLINNGEFTTIANKMVSSFQEEDLPALLDVLTQEFGSNVNLTAAQAGIVTKKVDDDPEPDGNRLMIAQDAVRDALPGTISPVVSKETTQDVLQRIAKGDGPLAAMAAQLLRTSDTTSLRVPFVVAPISDGRSYYDPSSDTIFLTPEHAANDYVVLHEILHAATAKKLPQGLRSTEDILRFINDPASNKDVVQLAKVYLQALSKLGNNAYGLTSLDEFVAEAFTNKMFRENLSRVPYKATKQNIWQRLVEAIKGVLGIRSATLLDKVTAAGLRIINNQSRYVDRSGRLKAGVSLADALRNLAFIRLVKPISFDQFAEEVMNEFDYGKQPAERRIVRMAYQQANNIHSALRNTITTNERQTIIDAEPLGDLKKNISKFVEDDMPKAEFEDGITSGVKNDLTDTKRKEFGIAPATKTVMPVDDVKAAADSIQATFDIKGLIARILDNREEANNVEIELLGRYIAGKEGQKRKLDKQIVDTVTAGDDISQMKVDHDVLLQELQDAYNAARKTGTETARALAYRKQLRVEDDSLAAMFKAESDASGVSRLTPEQLATVNKEYEELQAAKKKYQEKIAKLQAENNRLRAEKKVKEASQPKAPKAAKEKTVTKKTHDDFVNERNHIIEDIRKKLRDARRGSSGLTAVPIPYFAELVTIAPDVAKLVKSLVSEGVTKLGDLVDNVHEILKDDINGITKKDVINLIAGEYDEKKTRNKLQQQVYDLRRQARLINELEDVISGKKKTRNAVQKSRETERLENAIKNLRKMQRQGVTDPLTRIKVNTSKKIADIEGKIARGEYGPDVRAPKIVLDKEALELKDELIRLRSQRRKRLAQANYDKLGPLAKFAKNAKEVSGSARSLMTTVDLSGFRQVIIAAMAHPEMAFRNSREMFRNLKSEKVFDRWLFDIKESDDYQLMRDSGLHISDPNDPTLDEKEELFASNLVQKIPFYGTNLIKGSERAYVTITNAMRVDVFRQGVEQLQKRGITFDNNPKAYKSMASWANNSTGRGKLAGSMEKAAPFFGALFFAPRLMAARLNALNPAYYARLEPEVRKMAIDDMVQFLTFGATVLALAAAALPCDVAVNPKSSDFGKVRCGDTRYDIWGGFQPYVRVAWQALTKERVDPSTREIEKVKSEEVGFRFLRGKLAPIPSSALDLVIGRDIVGQESTLKDEALSLVSPLIVKDVLDAYRSDPAQALPAWVLGTFGVSVQTYQPR